MYVDRDEVDEPASIEVTGTSGGTYNLNTIPGAAKKRLIQSGELTIEKFIGHNSIPGKKLAELRAAYKAQYEGTEVEANPDIPNPYKVGDLVVFRGYTTEVMESDAVKGVRIRKREGGKKWVHHSKVQLAETEE